MASFKDLKENEKLSETQYYTVVKKAGKKVQIRNDFGENVVVDEEYVEKCLNSASQFAEEKVVGKTEAANLFLQNQGIVMTVNFNKQVNEKDAKEQLYELYANKGGKVLSEADYKRKVNSVVSSIIVGEERTMIGRHYGNVTEFGRVYFVDMEKEKVEGKDYDTRMSQVDPRTINWLIIKGTKYKVK